MSYSSALFDGLGHTSASAPARVGRPRARPGPQGRAAARQGQRRRGHPGARDRHRLGRAGHPRGPPRGDRAHRHPLAGAAGPRPRADRRAGFADRVTVDLLDYRDVDGTYDAVVSVEMIEAVGYEYWPTYFETIDRLLAPGGSVAIQAITMPHDRMLATRNTYTWVHKYIFPGGFLPSTRAIQDVTATHTSLRVVEWLSMGSSYAQTLRLWDERFREPHRRRRGTRLRRGLPPDVALLPGVLPGRVRLGLPRRAAVRPPTGGDGMSVIDRSDEPSRCRPLGRQPRGPSGVAQRLAARPGPRRRRRAAGAAHRLGRQRRGPRRRSVGGRAHARRDPPDPLAPGRARGRAGLRHRRARGRGRPQRGADPRLEGHRRAGPQGHPARPRPCSPACSARPRTSAPSARLRPPPTARPSCAAGSTAPAATATRSTTTTTCPTSSTPSSSTRTWPTRRGYWRSDDPGYTVEDAQRDKLDLVCRKVGLESRGRCASSTSAAAGARSACMPRSTSARRSPA